jgi:ring-1,2-phenylacetyl-CoA epoxidase subunit PaaD
VVSRAPTAVTAEAVHAALDAVPDPEMPPVSIAELGMVVDVRVDGAQVAVDLVPTYSGCPAIAVIREAVTDALLALDGVEGVEVAFTDRVVWEPSRIAASAKGKLADFGIAPPGSGQTLLGIGGVTCPMCGSRDTVVDSPFGPTPCRASNYCNACRNPFEAIKP